MGQEVKKPKTQPITVGFNEPPRTDESPQFVKIMDSNNVCLSPDGSEARNIDGSIVTNAYRVTTSPVGWKAIVRETNPPDVDQRMYMIIDTAGGRNRVEQIEFGRNLGRLEQASSVTLTFDEENWDIPINDLDAVSFRIVGEPTYSGLLSGRTYDGTAIAGVDYLAFATTPPYDTVTVNGDDGFGALPIRTLAGATAGRYYYVEMWPISAGIFLSGPARVTVHIVP